MKTLAAAALLFLLLAGSAAFVQVSALKPYLPEEESSSSIQDDESPEEGCKEGHYFSLTSDRCLACTECGPNLYTKERCSDTSDTVCDWCLAEEPTLNEDYFRQCRDYRKLYERIREDFRSEVRRLREETADGFRSSGLHYNWVWLLYTLLAAASILSAMLSFWMFCARRRYTRIVNVTPPELTESDQHNIIFAAKHIQEKLANRRGEVKYEYL